MRWLCLPLIVVATLASAAQTAKPEDVKSVDSIVAALYDVISGAPGANHDWDRMRSLFVENGKLAAVLRTANGDQRYRTFSVDDYIKLSGPYIEKQGFVEREIGRKTEQFGGICHVFSTYESRVKADDKKPFERGINSLQLYNDGKRWWIVSILWQGEDDKTPLPAKYIGGRG